MAEQGLKDKTVKGLGWSAIDNVSRLGVTFVVSIVLARLLSPDDYGLIGILTIFISVFIVIVESGFTSALIRKKEVTDVDYSTIFYTNLIVSICMAGVLFFCSGPIAYFFDRQELAPLMKVMSINVFIIALSIVQKARTTRNIDFKTQTKVTLIASIGSGAIGITCAYLGYGVWSLVIQQIALNLLTTIFYWIFNKWLPKLVFSWDSFHEMWSFGWKLLISNLIDTTWKEIYQVVIGKFYTPATLGLYTRAKQFSDLCSYNLTSVIQRVSYPVLSSIQDDKIRLKAAYQRIIKTTMLVSLCLMLGMAAVAKQLILVLIGPKWIECVPLLQLICISGMLYPLHAINLNMLQVQGRSDLFLRLEIIKKLIAIGPILLGIFISIYWMLGASVIVGFISYYLNAYYSGPYLNYSIKDQVKDILPSFYIALTMAIPVYLIGFIPLSVFVLLPIQIVIGFIIVVCLCNKTNLPEYKEIKGIILPQVGRAIKR